MSDSREHIAAAKQRLADGYESLKKLHIDGCSGIELCLAMSDLRDEVIRGLLERAIDEIFGNSKDILTKIAVVAHGGYGRRELAPASDVDLMLLHSSVVAEKVKLLAQRIVCDIFDCGLQLGHSVRTVRQAVQLSAADPAILTSLIETRLLFGDGCLLGDLNNQLDRYAKQHIRAAIATIDASRSLERREYGDTVFLLEPNVKRSPGTLRDLQLIRWVGYLRYGSRDPDELLAAGALSREDYTTIAAAREFLLHLRADMHFHADGANDVLSREEQLRIATSYDAKQNPQHGDKPNLSDSPAPADTAMLPVERFMREYFRHTAGVAHVATSFLTKAQSRDRVARFASAVFGHRVEGGLRVGISGLTMDQRGLELLRGNLTEIMRLVSLSNLYDKPIAPATWEAVRRAAPSLPEELPNSACLRFLSLLEHPNRLSQILRDLHEIGILERFIPEYAHARGLLQFNAYHKYTVDEHCLRGVEFATTLTGEDGLLAEAYRKIKSEHKKILHLAILIHDLGKGFAEDHRHLAVKIAQNVSKHLGINSRDAETLEFLAANHDMMNHAAFRRDYHDERLLVDFAAKVGSLEILRMLFVLSAADLAAVGPGVWDGWKSEILTDLFQNAAMQLGGEAATLPMIDAFSRRRDTVRRALGHLANRPWFQRQLDQLPSDYINATDPRCIADDLLLLHDIPVGQAAARVQYVPESNTVQVTVGINGHLGEGAFHKLTGVLTSLGLEIRSAHIHTLADELITDRFCAYDGDYCGHPPADRLEEIEHSIIDALKIKKFTPPKFRKSHGTYRQINLESPECEQNLSNGMQVRVDNTTSADYTILDVFAHDRPGLLYEIAHELFDMDLSVSRAKIGTHRDQIVDVFYVTDNRGQKITDEPRLEALRDRLLRIAAANSADLP